MDFFPIFFPFFKTLFVSVQREQTFPLILNQIMSRQHNIGTHGATGCGLSALEEKYSSKIVGIISFFFLVWLSFLSVSPEFSAYGFAIHRILPWPWFRYLCIPVHGDWKFVHFIDCWLAPTNAPCLLWQPASTDLNSLFMATRYNGSGGLENVVSLGSRIYLIVRFLHTLLRG